MSGMARQRQPLRQGAEHRHAGTRCRGPARRPRSWRPRRRSGCPARADERLRSRISASVAAADERAPRRSSLPASTALCDRPDASRSGPVGLDGEAEQLGDLAQQHRQRDAVHVAVADRLREQLGDEAEAREARRDAHERRTRSPSRPPARRRVEGRPPRAAGRPPGSPPRARNPVPARGSGSGRTTRTRAAARSWRRVRRCPARRTPRRKRCRPAPASSSAPVQRRDRVAASSGRTGAEGRVQEASAAILWNPHRRFDEGSGHVS